MSKEANYFRIGVFILIGVAILVGALIVFGVGQIFQPRIYMETYVDATVQGVDVGSPVKFQGVQIGRVNSVGFSMMEYEVAKKGNYFNYVVIVMEITKEVFPGMFDDDFQPMLTKAIDRGLRLRIEPLGITGISYLEMSYVDPKQFPLLSYDWPPRNYYMPSAPGQLTNILDSVNKMMRDIDGFNLAGMIEKINTLLENANKAMTDAQFGKLSTDMQTLIASLNTAIAEANVSQLSREAQTMLSKAGGAADNLDRILKNVEPTSRASAEDLEATLQNLKVITENLTAFSVAVRANPARLIWGGGGSKPESEASPSPESQPKPSSHSPRPVMPRRRG